MKEKVLAIGIMSGTSLDGIDTVIAELTKSGKYLKTIDENFMPFSSDFKNHLKKISESITLNKEELVRTDKLFGTLIAEVINQIITKNEINKTQISVIGSHGLTIGHFPEKKEIFGRETSFTLQIGDGDVISSLTGIPVVSDFRRKDMAVNGEGAPLIPIIDKILFQAQVKKTCCLNIGGLSNITNLPQNEKEPIVAFDTGPGNCLTDIAISMYQNPGLQYDPEGQYAKLGKIDKNLLNIMLKDPYFKKHPPKSTGKEYFGKNFIEFITANSRSLEFKDVFTTISYLTPLTIANAINDFIEYERFPEQLIVSGGGAKNHFFMENLRLLLPKTHVEISDNFGISSDFKEAIGFAILGYLNLIKVKGSIPSVTGANSAKVLGKLSIPE